MAERGNLSPYSSRSVSPERYDPFDPPLDPIEMSNQIHLSDEHQRDRSPGEISLSSLPAGSYFPGSRDDGASGQYAALPRRAPTTHTSAGTSSLNSMFSGLYPYKTHDADTQALVDRRAGELAQWQVHWSTPAIILALFVAGLIGALGHHFFYVHLDGKPAEAQLRMIRYGTALAFFVKSTLVGTVILCYRQRIWTTFRNKTMTIKAIDGLFSATEDPTQFIVWEMVRNAKLATVMAICSWLIPIASVLSPASLTSEPRTMYNHTQCPAVASLNFTHESSFNFRNESNFPGSSIIYYNTTDTTGKMPGFFDYYDQPSKNARRLTVTSVYLKKPATYPNASIDSCGEGWNCEYSISFQGPGYKCDEIANSSNPNTQEIIAGGAPFNISTLAPKGEFLYYSSVDIGDYASPQVDTKDDGTPAQGPPYPDSLGVFESEPVLWIGYARNTSTPYDRSTELGKKWGNVHEASILKCVAHHTKYTFDIQFNETIQSATRKSRNFIAPIVDTMVNAENRSDVVASPSSNYVRPNTDVGKYKLTAAYHAMGSLLRNFLRGSIAYTPPYYVTKSDISESRLVEAGTSYPLHNLMEGISSVYEDMIITLLSESHLVIAQTESVPCIKSKTMNVYIYHREGLWVGYAIVVAVAFVSIIVGAWSIFQNGVASDTQFSRIMVTTRNPTIDRLSVGACLGGDPFPKELRETKLRFGVLLEDDHREGPFGNVEHCCFGAAGETKDIVKYGTYAGLRKWRKVDEEEAGDVLEKGHLLGEADTHT
ncbi:uncharacterized protein BDR25DRAFT_301962 [Lindgomyces ingoldianus]|uniref:Uncharacterized protein n=1 Tax=Lindgomyces ingoldianus TaxID=673940 RepID=A0ACB6R492_9PLEO|nr:uncharacterized protein BDR25DRAFT_301962 [Lindgomyces ingoldianus]KAF2473882.1 hypothetical protein BDR25DRAFT_301962 [Lindgomyces ingoldianus]